MFVQPEQIRAARAMLDWSQQDLAEAAGVSKDTVKNYELGNNKPNSQTLTRIVGALEMAGVEFGADGGIRPNKKRIRTLEGHEGLRQLMDMVFKACQENKTGHIIVANVQQDMYTKWLGDYAQIHRDRMSALEVVSPLKFLIREGDKKYSSYFNYVEYRIIDDRYFGDVGLYCFQNYVGIISFVNDECNITLIENPMLNSTMDKVLNMMWENAEPYKVEIR